MYILIDLIDEDEEEDDDADDDDRNQFSACRRGKTVSDRVQSDTLIM